MGTHMRMKPLVVENGHGRGRDRIGCGGQAMWLISICYHVPV